VLRAPLVEDLPALLDPVRRWDLWRLPRGQRCLVIAVQAVAAAVAVVAAWATPLRVHDLVVFAILTGCGALSVEAVRRLGEPTGVSKDLLVAWTLPVALLLSPLYGVLAPAALYTLTQVRVRRTMLHRRMFTIASVGLADAVAGLLFRSVTGSSTEFRHWSLPIPVVALVALACGVVLTLMNTTLISVAAAMSSPESSWWSVFRDGRMRLLDGLGITTATVVLILCSVNAVLVLIALPSVIFLQRCLLHDELRTAARTDPKTGLLNATSWNREAEREIAQAVRTGLPLAVLLLDIDHFKGINDSYGHLIGDQVLTAIAAAIQDEVRTYDIVGRFGGEEFVLALPGTGHERARIVAERLRQRLGALALTLVGREQVHVTVSIGAALLGDACSQLTELLAAADAALYRAKTGGRDRISIAGDVV
jgi:diguanylate cyclase (GGDEF)-like protein